MLSIKINHKNKIRLILSSKVTSSSRTRSRNISRLLFHTASIFVSCWICSLVQAEQVQDSPPPKWEAGLGSGAMIFEHYPASDQSTHLALPVFPTLQYRGPILRADDREGARLVLYNSPEWTLQMGGVGFPPLASNSNTARRDMPDLPLVAGLGPQIEKHLTDRWDFKFGTYQALAATWLSVRPSGAIWEFDFTYRSTVALAKRPISLGFEQTSSSISLSLMGASQEVNEIYFGVSNDNATSTRSNHSAGAGIMQSQISLFQIFKRADAAFYIGIRASDHHLSANRASPLHKTDTTLAGFLGVTYSLYKSNQVGVSEESAPGFIRSRSSPRVP